MNSGFKELLCIFNEGGVRYLIAGGQATIDSTEPRFTKDYDVWVEPSEENAERVLVALARFGAPVGGVAVKEFATPGLIFMMGVPPMRIGILTSIDGADFAEAWPRRQEVKFEGFHTWFISREDLIRNKRAVGRRQDLIDADLLEGKLGE
jgi:hypothetical protein